MRAGEKQSNPTRPRSRAALPQTPSVASMSDSPARPAAGEEPQGEHVPPVHQPLPPVEQDVPTTSGLRKTRRGMGSLQKFTEDAYDSWKKEIGACPHFSQFDEVFQFSSKILSYVMDAVEAITSEKLSVQCFRKGVRACSELFQMLPTKSRELDAATVLKFLKNCAPEGATWLENWESYIDDVYQELKHSSTFGNGQATTSFSSKMLEAILAAAKDDASPSSYEQFAHAVDSAKHELQQVTDEETWLQTLKRCAPLNHADRIEAKSREEDQLCKEFERNYEDPGGFVLSSFMWYIDRYYMMWRSNSLWYAPCTSIVQSSGWGKSRLVREIAMAPNHIMVFYFSLMDPERVGGYPLSHPAILQHFLNIESDENAYAIFHACFHWLSEQESFPKKDDLFVDHQKRKYHRILPKILRQPTCSKEDMVNACMKAVARHSTSLRKEGVGFLFVLDEARTLVEHAGHSERPFAIFRRACADLPRDGCSFVLFIDTTPKLPNFTIRSRYDPSLKVVRHKKHLFPPISKLPTFDLISTSLASMSLDDIASPQVWLKQGRPLWASKNFSEETWVKDILLLAERKLLGGWEINSIKGKKLLYDNPYMSLVLLGRRIGVDVCPQSSAAEDLVASHMSACLHVSALREFVLCSALPEPALNEAAAIALRRGDQMLLKQQLRQLNSLLLNGIASAGERGELVATFLLIHAMDTLQDPEVPTKPVFLEEFLKAFVIDFHGFSPTLEHWKQAQVFFNAFHRFHGKPSVQDARRFLKKGFAIICTERQEAFDLYIPFVIPDDSGEYNVENDNCIGCLGVQVRDRKNVCDIPATLAKMRDYQRKTIITGESEVLVNVLMLLHLGADKEEENPSTQEKGKERSGSKSLKSDDAFVLNGLNMVFVPDDLCETIKELLYQLPDPLSIVKAEMEERKPNPLYKEMVTDEAIRIETEALRSTLSVVCPNNQVAGPASMAGTAVVNKGGESPSKLSKGRKRPR